MIEEAITTKTLGFNHRREGWVRNQRTSHIGAPSATRPSIEYLASDETSRLTFKVTTSQDLPGTGFKANGESTRWKVTTTYISGSDEFADVYTDVHYNPAVFNLTPCDVQRWRLAREAMDKYRLQKPDKNLDLVTMKPVAEHMDQSNNPDETTATWPRLGFSTVGAVYGGLHALAWNAPFPSHRETVLWRVSALLIASPAVICLLMMLLYYATLMAAFVLRSFCLKLAPAPKPKQKPQREPPPVKEETSSGSTVRAKKIAMSTLRLIGDISRYLAGPAFCCLYFTARGYLVFESFRTVFFLPPEAYEATMWTQYLPHIT
ncbi:hypothetical protein MMC11_000937 [Xylographa trunciseda]|nr:hypothetical protein [Xylographa trunciseda]